MSFDGADMRKFIESLGTTIVIKDIEAKHEHHFVEEIKRDVEGGALGSLVTRYLPLVTLMDRCDKLHDPVRKCIVEIIVEALQAVDKVMVEVNDDVKDLSEEIFKNYQQVVAVVLYMSYKCLEEFNFCASVQTNNSTVSKKDKARSRSSYGGNSKDPFGFWPRQRDRLLDALSAVIQKNLYPLWERIKKPNGKTFYGLIVQGLVATVKYGAKDIMRDNFASKTVVSMFSHLIIKHNFEDDIVMHLMQNILDSEDIARSITKVILTLRMTHGRLGVVRKSIQVAFELINRPENRDKWDKGFTSFLLDVGTTFPEDVLEHSLPYIVTLLEADSVAVRSAVLSIIVEVISHTRAVDKNTKNDSPAAVEKAAALRKQLLEYLETYMRDANAVVRAKAVAAVTGLLQSGGASVGELIPLIYEAGERILDVSAGVRKNSFGVFAGVILNDPLLASQTPQQFRTKVLRSRRELVSIRTKNIDDAPARLRIVVKEFTDQLHLTRVGITLDSIPVLAEIRDPEGALDYIKTLLQKGDYWEACECFYKAIKTFDDIKVFRMFDLHTYEYYMKFFTKELGLNQEDENQPEEIPDTFETDMLETMECQTARGFLTHMHTLEALSDFLYNKVIPIVLKLFRYGVASDQAEVMGYLATLSDQKYPLPPQVPIVILDCISRVDKSAVSQIVQPFIVIFLNGPNCDTPSGFVKTLITLVDNLGVGKRNHMNLLIQEMVRNKRIHIPALKVLWEIVTLVLPEYGEKEAKIALYILGICGKADRNCILSLFSKIIHVGLGPRGCQDMELAAIALAAIFESLRKSEEELSHKKLPADHELFVRIYEVIRHALSPETGDQANEYFSKVADIGVSLIYDCCLAPAKAISPIIIGCYKWIFGSNDVADENDIPQFEMSEKTMFKFLSLAGAITGSHASYHSKYVLDEVKRRKMLIALETSDARNAVKTRLRESVAEIHRRKSVGNGRIVYSKSVDDQLLKADEEELDAVVGQVGFDKETELIRNYMDKLLDEGTFRFYWHNILFICRRYKNLKSLRVRVAAIRLLVKLMLVGQKALTGLMDSYIDLWKEVKTTEEKVELVLSAILLNDCYPNQMNTVNGQVIMGLKSESAEVRQATLDFVTFLTLNDVLKLREILPDTICRLADPVQDIQEVTKLFLKECHEKDTMLHSAIPDMIIRLSATDELTSDMFQEIMKGLLEPIKKVNEVIGIGNKLLERFGGEKLNRGREAQNNAVCLSLLNFNDKFFKSVRESLPQYEKYLDDDIIFECFTNILQTAKDNLKPENKEKLEAYEEKLQDARERASELRRMNNANKNRNGSLNKSTAAVDSSSDESEPEAEGENEAAPEAEDEDEGADEAEDEDEAASEAEDEEKLEVDEEKPRVTRQRASELRLMNNANKDRNASSNKSTATAASSSEDSAPEAEDEDEATDSSSEDSD